MAGRTPHSCWLVVFSCCRLPGNHPWITVATKTFDSWFRIDSITIPTYCDHLTVLVTIAQQLEAPWQQEMKCQEEKVRRCWTGPATGFPWGRESWRQELRVFQANSKGKPTFYDELPKPGFGAPHDIVFAR